MRAFNIPRKNRHVPVDLSTRMRRAHPAHPAHLLLAAALLCLTGCSEVGAWTGVDAAWLHQQQLVLMAWQQASPLPFALGYFVLFTALSALALPGCGLLALCAGLCFGWWSGTVLVLLASTCGATLSFLVARHIARDAVQRRFGARLAPLERALARDGVLMLLALRLAPVIPYFAVNPLLGLSSMRLRLFFFASALGMLPGSAAYVQAGTDLARFSQGGPMLSPALLAALLSLSLLPLAARWWWRRREAALPMESTP